MLDTAKMLLELDVLFPCHLRPRSSFKNSIPLVEHPHNDILGRTYQVQLNLQKLTFFV